METRLLIAYALIGLMVLAAAGLGLVIARNQRRERRLRRGDHHYRNAERRERKK